VKYAAYFREKGAQALLDGMPPIDPGPGIQVKAKPGDAIIAHYLLGHGITPNVSPHVRYACFFRLRSVDLEQRRRETMQDPWLDWDGMRDLSE
jgi:ectoine hydroxylase-related dioxygenase (phytanoyl-CoA dioxygenase family)